ncbi:MAG TPA: D-alanine--D-alanine ligase family protein [Gammaproteobacteria bacterium]|nr:D-alanine--D-alanine ligase family protein [Gammaproteobacteria bacterium]
MSESRKIRVAVLYGGRSGEHEVSLSSAMNVIRHLDRTRFEVVPIGIDKQGVWFLGDDVLKKELNDPTTLRLSRDLNRMLFKPDSLGQSVETVQPAQLLSRTNQSGRVFDVIFPVIHGTLCEDGTVQGLLELADVPYVGCSVLASAMGMEKDISKRLAQAAGIRVARYEVINQGQWDKNPALFCKTVAETIGFPAFVKPANTGSSVGVEKVKRAEELVTAIENAFRYDTKIIVEQGIDAIELEVAVLESSDYGADPIVSVVGEVRPSHEFYSYAAKYLDENGAELIIPALLSEELQARVQQAAKLIFKVLECEGMARVDLFLDRHTQEIYFNEVNTIPGFTQISMYPKLMNASGMAYSDLLTHLVQLSIARHARKSKLSREYVT